MAVRFLTHSRRPRNVAISIARPGLKPGNAECFVWSAVRGAYLGSALAQAVVLTKRPREVSRCRFGAKSPCSLTRE
jgi:hypothetical protein